MTRTSIQEYTEAARWRYLRSPKTEEGKILDEFTKVTGYHRKAVICLLHQANKPRAYKKRRMSPAVQCGRGRGTTGRLGGY